MIRKINNLRLLLLVIGMFLIAGTERAQAQHEHHGGQNSTTQITPKENPQPASTEVQMPIPQKSAEEEKAISSMTLAELEQMALANNPTLKQSDLAIRAAEGRKTQSGLLSNPIVGFSAEDLSFRNFGDGAKAGFFIEQKIPLGGKLSKNRRVFEQEINKAEANREAQRARVLNSVRLLYFEALGAQRLVEIKKDLAKLAEESVDISAELYNVGLADCPDRIKTEIEQQRAEAEYVEARSRYEAVWQKIGAMVGSPGLLPVLLSGNLADFQSEIDSEELLANLLAQSPEIKTAQFQVERAKAVLKRARAEKVPDLYLRGGVGYNNELIEQNGVIRRAGTEGFIEVGVSLPIFNRNQGGIKTAEAELAIAEREVERLKLALRTRFAQVLSDYRTALFLADKYAKQILPKAKIAYEMYSANFQSMTAGYTNVLATRAAYLKAQVEYARNMTAAQKSVVLLKGFLLSGGLNAPGDSEAPDREIRVSAENPVNEEDEDRQ